MQVCMYVCMYVSKFIYVMPAVYEDGVIDKCVDPHGNFAHDVGVRLQIGYLNYRVLPNHHLVHTYIHQQILTYTHIHSQALHTYIHTYTHSYTHTCIHTQLGQVAHLQRQGVVKEGFQTPILATHELIEEKTCMYVCMYVMYL